MTNNVLYVSDGDYGTPAGYTLPLVQGQFGQSVPLEIRDLAGNVVPLTGYSTITGHKRKGGNVTALVGTLTLSGTPTVAPQITWVIDEDDTGQDGAFSFFLEITNGTIVYTTHPVSLTIVKDPAVNATAAPGLVSVTTAQKALLASIQVLTGLVKMAAGTATGIAVQSFMETFLGSANAGAALTSIGAETAGAAATVQTNLDTHTGLSTSAHGGILPEDAGIVAVNGARDIATTDRGKILECNGTFTLTCPNGISGNLQCAVINVGTGVITLAATTTLTTKDSAVTLANQYGAATVYHAGSNVWRAFGDLS